MKHIKLWEQIVSELPKIFSRQEIESMSPDSFFDMMKIYKTRGDVEQAWTTLQVWMKSQKKNHQAYRALITDPKFVGKFEDLYNFIGPKADELMDFVDKEEERSRKERFEKYRAEKIQKIKNEIAKLQDELKILKMKHIKEYRVFEAKLPGWMWGDKIYVAILESNSGPDYNFECLIVFRGPEYQEGEEVPRELKNAFISAFIEDDSNLHDKSILDKTYTSFDDFMDDAIEDGYYTSAGWSLSISLYDSFFSESYMKVENKYCAITYNNDGWGWKEKKEERKVALDELSDMLGKDKAKSILDDVI